MYEERLKVRTTTYHKPAADGFLGHELSPKYRKMVKSRRAETGSHLFPAVSHVIVASSVPC